MRRAATHSPIVYQIRVSLAGISPEIWRRIVVPETYTFWDLHVAIQDAMGWFDSHLHEFDVSSIGKNQLPIGIPDEDGEIDRLPGWKVGISKHLYRPGQRIGYLYDFGDSWHHQILLEGMFLADPSRTYPLCIAGEGACPPEDCGGVRGYERVLEVLRDPGHEEHEEMIVWLQGIRETDRPYIASEFNAELVRFSDPWQRWIHVFQSTF